MINYIQGVLIYWFHDKLYIQGVQDILVSLYTMYTGCPRYTGFMINYLQGVLNILVLLYTILLLLLLNKTSGGFYIYWFHDKLYTGCPIYTGFMINYIQGV